MRVRNRPRDRIRARERARRRAKERKQEKRRARKKDRERESEQGPPIHSPPTTHTPLQTHVVTVVGIVSNSGVSAFGTSQLASSNVPLAAVSDARFRTLLRLSLDLLRQTRTLGQKSNFLYQELFRKCMGMFICHACVHSPVLHQEIRNCH